MSIVYKVLRRIRDVSPRLFQRRAESTLGSDLDISHALAMDCAQNICWMIDAVATESDALRLKGWALVTVGLPEEAQFQVNGVTFSSVRFPIDSPDLAEHFYGAVNSARARFECEIALSEVPANENYQFEFVQGGDRAKARRTAWWYPATIRSDDELLTGERISRVVGSSDTFNFELGGATLFNRIQDHLTSRFGLHYRDLHAILDWGCGAGRLLSQFAAVIGPQVWGSDVDHDNLKYCQEKFRFARCQVFPLVPPTDIPDATFDLIVGISVCTHLSEENQALWLAELRRMSRPGGLVLLSVQGPSQTALYREPPELMRRLEQSGFVTKRVNPRINDIIGAASYYLDVVQSRAHIREHWGREFEVLEFLDGFAANQDLVVMRVPGGGSNQP